MKAEYVRLIDLILSKGHRIDVDTGGDEPDVRHSNNRSEILMAIESVDLSEITVYARDDKSNAHWRGVFWAMIIPFGVAPDETVVDYLDNGYYTTVITDGDK